MAVLGLSSGQTALVVSEPRSEQSGGLIVTSVDDMPTLQELLESYQVVTAILELPPPALEVPSGPEAGSGRLAWWRVMVAVSIGAVVSTAGWLLLLSAVVRHKLAVNPYIGLTLGLGGIVLMATAAAALRQSGSRIE